jgi:hypothetical protein
MSEKPTVYLSNWSSSKTPGHHGPGRKLTIMARPRAWEMGVGCVPWLTPNANDLVDVKAGRMTLDQYKQRFEESVALHERHGHLRPDDLAIGRLTVGWGSVVDGDTLCCACSRDEASAGRCHRVWSAHALARSGWRVILDGVELHAPTGAGNLPPKGV